MPFYKVSQYMKATTIMEAESEQEACIEVDFHKLSDYGFWHVEAEEIEKPKDWED